MEPKPWDPLEREKDGILCGESRSGPEPLKLGCRGAARPPRHLVSCSSRGLRTAHRAGLPGFKVIQGCARGSHGLQQSATALGHASRKRAVPGSSAMEGALGRSSAPPLTRWRAKVILAFPLRGGELNPLHLATERDRERQRQGHDPRSGRRSRSAGSAARRAFDQRLIRSEQGWDPRETGDNREPCRSWRLAVKRGSTRSRSPPRLRPGGRRGSHHHRRKRVAAVIRESSDLGSARGAGRLQMLGRRIFPGGSAR